MPGQTNALAVYLTLDGYGLGTSVKERGTMATAANRGTATGNRTPAQMFALVFGVVYLLVGLVGFAATGFDNFATFSEDSLLIFNVNPLHNLVHLAIGGVWIAS